MSQYGELIGVYNPVHAQIYEEFDKYFNHPKMTKIRDDGNYSIYMTKTYCLLSNEYRYLVAIVPKDTIPLDKTEKLSELPWVSFQTRTLPVNHKISPHSYTPTRTGFLGKIIDRTVKQENSSTYSCPELPITITLLYPKNNGIEYQNKGTILAALETYQTIITLNA
jgi:hypothetical protein